MKKHSKIIAFISFFVLFTIVANASEPFRFALFSDLHISSVDSIPSLDLQNAVKEVNNDTTLEFVLVSGDITQRGDTVELKEARRLLQRLKVPFYIVPGNHDFRWEVGAGASNFKRIFGSDKFMFTYKNIVFAGCASVPNGESAKGYIQTDDINWVSQSLKNIKPQKPVIFVTHYPILEGDIDNWSEISSVLDNWNVKAVLGGHYHRNVLLNYNGIPGVVNRSTLRAKNTVGGYSIYSISDTFSVSEKCIGEPEDSWMSLPIELITKDLKSN